MMEMERKRAEKHGGRERERGTERGEGKRKNKEVQKREQKREERVHKTPFPLFLRFHQHGCSQRRNDVYLNQKYIFITIIFQIQVIFFHPEKAHQNIRTI